jgi:serine/threonine protein kinase
MLTGRRAFEGDSAISTLTAVLRDEPADICILNRDVPQALADVVYRCLRKQPGERYPTAADLKTDLETALQRPVLRATEAPTIAVVPFQNFTTEGNDFFAEGLMQELAAAFAGAPGLRVVSKSCRATRGFGRGPARLDRTLRSGTRRHFQNSGGTGQAYRCSCAQEACGSLAYIPGGFGAIEALHSGFLGHCAGLF